MLSTPSNPLSTPAPRALKSDFLSTSMFSATVPGSESPLFRDVTLDFSPSQKYALVGPNGCGKSTFVKQLVNEYYTSNGMPPVQQHPLITEGALSAPRSEKYRMGYISQSSVSLSDRTVLDECVASIHNYDKIKSDLEDAQNKVASGDFDDDDLNDLVRLETEFEAAGGYNVESNVMQILKGLSFTDEDASRLCSSFSGGWQMRISLCKLLISRPDFMVLDEPSNHLDSHARSWLANHLETYPGAIVLVSHDVALINKVCRNIVEFNPIQVGGVSVYKNVKSYNAYLLEKQRRYDAALAEYERNAAEAARLQDFVDKFGASATKAKAAQSKLKQIERMQKSGMLVHPGTLTLSGSSQLEKVGEGPGPNSNAAKVQFPSPPPGGDVLLELKKCDIGYSDTTKLLSGVDLSIEAGMRVIVRGPNGAGKSTLLKALVDREVSILSGERWLSPGAALNVFTQDLAQDLPTELTPVECVAQIVREYDVSISDTVIRSVLGQLTLTSRAQTQKIGMLSGGEKARVALASFILKPANLLVLDEPSNHVDVDTIAALAKGLANFEDGEKNKRAAVVIISHDREFVEQVQATHVCEVHNGKVTMEERNLRDEDWIVSAGDGRSEMINLERVPENESTVETSAEEAKAEEIVELTSEQRKARHNAPKRIKKIEALIEKHELSISQVEDEMMTVGNDMEALMALTKKKEEAEKKVEELMEEYEMLESLLILVTSQ